MIGMPYLAAGALAATVAAGTGGFFFGQSYHAGKVAHRDLKALNQAIAERDAKQSQIDTLAGQIAGLEQQRQEEVRYVYQQVPKIIRGDPVYRNVCIGGDGVRLLEQATAIANGKGAGAAAGAAGPAAAAGNGDGSGDRQGHR